VVSASTDNLDISFHRAHGIEYCITKYLTLMCFLFCFFHTLNVKGISDSDGVMYDFAGPFTIGVGKLAFGPPTKFLKLDPSKCTVNNWDAGVKSGCEIYAERNHNLCFDNCHSHVAKCLNIMRYNNCDRYNMFSIGIRMFFYASFTDLSGVVKTFLPATLLYAVLLYFWVL